MPGQGHYAQPFSTASTHSGIEQLQHIGRAVERADGDSYRRGKNIIRPVIIGTTLSLYLRQRTPAR